MTLSRVIFSSEKDDWETPQWLFDELDQEFHFTIDRAANIDNRKCSIYYDNALTIRWTGIGFLNPPYSKIAQFVHKASLEQEHGIKTVLLLPSRTDTKWWHKYIWDSKNHQPEKDVQVRFIKGRLKFGSSSNSAPFPSCIVVMK